MRFGRNGFSSRAMEADKKYGGSKTVSRSRCNVFNDRPNICCRVCLEKWNSLPYFLYPPIFELPLVLSHLYTIWSRNNYWML